MSTFDLILLAVIAGFSLFGFLFGFIHTFGSIVGMVFGAYLASRYYEPLALWVIHATGWGENVSKIIIFALTFIVINRAIGFIFWIVDRTLSLVTRLPFINSLNRFLGLALGVIEGLITIGLVIYFAARFPISAAFTDTINHSQVAPYGVKLATVLLPLLPDALRLLRSTVDWIESAVRQ